MPTMGRRPHTALLIPASSSARSRRAARAVAAVFVGLVLLVALAPVASAHAVVVSSSPRDGERLPQAPGEVSVQFSESVAIELGGLTVLDAKGERVDKGDSSQPTPASLRVSLKSGLGDGTYVANYKVVSADGHAINGAIVFGVGAGQLGDVSALAQTTDPVFEALSKAAQFVTYLGALLAAGLAFFLGFIHDGGDDRRRIARAAQIGTVVAAFGVAATVVTHAALVTGLGLGAAFNLATLQPLLRQGLGWQSAALLVGLALCHLSVDARRTSLTQAMAFYGGLIATASFVLWGHVTESPRSWLTVPADIVHLAVAAAWFGGLVGLALVLHGRTRQLTSAASTASASATNTAPAPSAETAAPLDLTASGTAAADASHTATAVLEPGVNDPPANDAAPPAGSLGSTVQVVRRFSTAAAISVLLLTAAGLVLAYGELGSLGALTSTDYGRVLIIKTAVVALVLFTAVYNRFYLLPWLLAPHDASAAGAEIKAEAEAERAGWRTLLNTVRFEALAIVVVLAITGVLVNTPPGISAPTESVPFSQSRPFRSGKVSVDITPNQAGPNSFHVQFVDEKGFAADLGQKVTMELALPAKSIGPIQREMVKISTGHFLLEHLSDLSIPGTWTITFVVRVSDFDQERIAFEDTIT